MPSLTVRSPNLHALGPILEVTLAVHSAIEQPLRLAGYSMPAPIQVRAMIDTGAASTCIQEGIVATLGLKFIGKVLIHTPSSTIECYIYPLRLQFSNGFAVDISDVIAAPLPDQNVRCLIGRDVLALGILTYNGRANGFTLRF